MINRNGVGNAFGLIGAAIESTREAGRTDGFKEKTGDLRWLLARQLHRAVEVGLSKQGYAVSVTNDQPQVVDAADFTYDYSTITTADDAILHVWFVDVLGGGAVSYVWDKEEKGYRPNLRVCARLISRAGNSEMYFQAFVYGRDYRVENIEYLPFSARYAFSEYDTLLAQSGKAAQGLVHAVEQIGARIGAELADR